MKFMRIRYGQESATVQAISLQRGYMPFFFFFFLPGWWLTSASTIRGMHFSRVTKYWELRTLKSSYATCHPFNMPYPGCFSFKRALTNAPQKSHRLRSKHSRIQWNPDFSDPRFHEPPDISNQTLFPLDLLHSSSTISPPISRTLNFSKLPITRTHFGSRGTNWP